MLPDHEIEIRVRYHETDGQGHVHHANYIHYFELGRTEQMRASGHDFETFERMGWNLVVSEISCRYLQPCHFGDLLRLRTSIVRAKGARVVQQYELYRGDELLAHGQSTIASVDAAGKVKRLPQWMVKLPT